MYNNKFMKSLKIAGLVCLGAVGACAQTAAGDVNAAVTTLGASMTMIAPIAGTAAALSASVVIYRLVKKYLVKSA